MRGDITLDTTVAQRIPKNYCEQLYANKLDYLEEMDEFLKTCNLPRLNYEEIGNLNRQIMSNEIESVVKYLPTKKNSGPDGFPGEFLQTFRNEIIPSYINSFGKY